MTNLASFPTDKLGGKAALLRYIDELRDEVEAGQILGFAIAKVPADPMAIKTAWGYLASDFPLMHRMIAAISVLKFRLLHYCVLGGEAE